MTKRRNRSLEVANSFLYHVIEDLESAARWCGKGRLPLGKLKAIQANKLVNEIRDLIKSKGRQG